MSPEQLIVLAAIFISLLVRAAQQAATEARRREAVASKARAEEADARSAPRREVQAPAQRAAARKVRGEPRRVSRSEAPPSPARAPRDVRSLPGDVPALRRALVLATLLGPPRALKNPTALDSRER